MKATALNAVIVNGRRRPVALGAALLLCVSLLSACGKDDKNNGAGGSGDTIATVPQPSQRCLDTFSQQAWLPYQQHGFFPYQSYSGYAGSAQAGYYIGGGFGARANVYPPHRPHGPLTTPYPAWTPQRGFCGCPNGTIPICDNSAGLACVNQNHLHNMPYRSWGFDPIATNWNQLGWGSLPTQNSCYQGVAQSCHIGTQQCGFGAICMATVANSPIGVCVRH